MSTSDKGHETRFVQAQWRATTALPAAVVVLLALALYAALAYGIYNGLTRNAGGANDFYSRWMGARALFLRGANPYSDEVTRAIQLGMYGRLAQPDEDQVAFAYPLFAVYPAAPLVLLPYPVAQAMWMALLIMGVAAGALALAAVNRIALTPIAFTAIALGALLFYPSVRGIFLGQYALVSFTCIALAGFAIATGHETSAGILLGVSAVKPQPIVFLLPAILFWGWTNGRRRIVWGALGTLGALVISSFVLVPTWFGDFVVGLGRYAQYAPVGPPLETLFKLVLPGPLANFLFIGASAVLVGSMGAMVWCTRARAWDVFQPTLGFVALVTTLTAGRIGTPDQILLLIPWLAWLAVWCRQKQWVFAALSAALLLFLPWMLFFDTLEGNQEATVVTTALPVVTLGVFVALMIQWRQRRGAAE